ncbi:MAG TPA: hypothetical protein DEG17_00985 [Cyanobacteria bacterium UBA11149]|nr:hypothetical protein [Cyanobacteria bacterium UBA11367]HBE59084.1 hypothetical protein [Cyanobacteria bacterium UBA11366]HBK64130.1 hypothetical protein [Cyanobacteria bacterium UBA11166]HBR72764.1 hypothetical protein [Cyanobacteria bacterium UBA11159]HBS67942.1 hypothetical protein [Cyanobacteria bacterium UBA11153]HBW87488.1 hypothetical protein [Cyanobacteria bacterium UBA11149]HCA94050.1 hypothetical protein [Cyanobacteria bacterium UBA9226]
MKRITNFTWQIGERNLDNYALPPDDPLGELSDFELGLRRFCYECDRKVVLKIGEIEFAVFLDPDICMVLEDRLPEQIGELAEGKSIRIDFAESYQLTVILTPIGEMIHCQLKRFGDREYNYDYELDKEQVLGELRRFLAEVMQLAVNGGYVSLEDKEWFIAPAFAERIKSVIVVR